MSETKAGVSPRHAKRKRTTNPLSEARGLKRNAKQSKVETIWHRKSGAGFALFVAYYGDQPAGVVSNEKPSTERKIEGGTTKSLKQGSGESRAAKRRRKKKKGAAAFIERPSTDETQNSRGSLPQHLEPQQGRLMQALQATKGRYSHLIPFFTSMTRPLPLTFRIRKSRDSEMQEATHQVQKQLQRFSSVVAPVSYDASREIYQAQSSNVTRKSLAKVSPTLKELLVDRSHDGVLARQELGSMLPVYALSRWLRNGDRVLDMCASPGSKTLQVLELVFDKQTRKGRVVANDVNVHRLEALKAAVQRSGLPVEMTRRITYTNFDASIFPVSKSGKLFDAIVVDVPCSGDGTIRKDDNILPCWAPSIGNSLHSLQVQVLVRALQLIKFGGVVSYSTCSLNPIEDEAVVAAAIKRAQTLVRGNPDNDDDSDKPAVQLLEWPAEVLPGLKRRSGITHWKVADFTGQQRDGCYGSNNDDSVELRWHSTFSDGRDAGMESAHETMWPPNKTENLGLERCSRLWPQDQDTGGFFVALLQKKRELIA